jgi:hypothetical protein
LTLDSRKSSFGAMASFHHRSHQRRPSNVIVTLVAAVQHHESVFCDISAGGTACLY